MHGELLTLHGCAPTPLASYLKAVGVLRLVSSPAHHVSGEAIDACARGWWEGERFHLRTTLSRDSLLHFLLEDYAPTPIIAPWNGGSGFYPKDNTDGFDPLLVNQVAKRFVHYSSAVRTAFSTVRNLSLTEKPSGAAKTKLVAALRATLSDVVVPWIDAVLALSGNELAYPELLGTGGNDGRLDFTNNFARRLFSKKKGIFDASTGRPTNDTAVLLEGSLFSDLVRGLHNAAIGQFAPGAAGGPNATTGYSADSELNPWDFVLMLEGAVAFAGTATRRHQRASGTRSSATTRSGASFPFTVRSVSAGWGGVNTPDENDARAEFWAPLWIRPSRYCEIDSLFGEGRAVLNGRTARDGLAFARAVASLGISRGFREFERYGFLMRAGKAYLAAPIGRHTAAPSPGAGLVADLDAGGWLDRVRRIGRRDEGSIVARQTVKRLEDTLFELVATRRSPGSRGIEEVLVALGEVVAWLAVSEAGRHAVRTPPPVLSYQWVKTANDDSPEFRIAVALASIGIPAGSVGPRADNKAPESQMVAERQQRSKIAPPMAAHFAPLDERRFVSRRRAWSVGDRPPTVVWGSGGLIPNMIAVLERRLIEASIRGLEDKPFSAAGFARLSDICHFLSGDFDDARCAALLGGLVWARPSRLHSQSGHRGNYTMPFAYAALKPVFSPDAALRRIKVLREGARMPVPPGLLARLRTGGISRDGRATDAAVRTALARAQSSGLVSAFAHAHGEARGGGGRLGAGVRTDRLAAALLIPVSDKVLTGLIKRVFPTALSEEDDNPIMESTTHAA